MPGFHPVREAWNVGSHPGISQAEEQAFPLVCFSAEEITSRDLDRVRHLVLIGGNAIKFYKYDPSNTDDEDGENVILDSADRPFVLIQRGDRYDLPLGITGNLGDGEVLPATAIVTPLTLPAGLPGSYAASAQGAPAGSVTITYEMSVDHGATWSDAFTISFTAGNRLGVFNLAANLDLPAYSLLRPKGPALHDSGLAGLTVTVAALRSTT